MQGCHCFFMKTFTLSLRFEFTHEYDAETEVQIPISSPGFRIDQDLRQHAPSARYDSKASVVRTSLSLAAATHVYLKAIHKPDIPTLVHDAATSAAAHTALYNAAMDVADAAAPAGLSTRAVSLAGDTEVTQDLQARDPFARVTWKGLLAVTWAAD